jgi:nucleotide-binding universal stress UspA family protein
MNTVIVPVDYSDTSLHAARYAVQLFTGQQDVQILLYHHYSKGDDATEEAAKLEKLKGELNAPFPVETLAHHGSNSFIEDFEKAVRHRRASLVVMGITGKTGLAKVFIGSNTLKFAETKAAPVLIIPEKSSYRTIKNVMLATDFHNAYQTTPSAPIKEFLGKFDAKLHIVNVDPKHYVAISEAYQKESRDIEKMFAEFDPEFYFMRLFDLDDALTLFAKDKNIDLIIAVHKEHSFYEKLFKPSTTKHLSYESDVPILVVHE